MITTGFSVLERCLSVLGWVGGECGGVVCLSVCLCQLSNSPKLFLSFTVTLLKSLCPLADTLLPLELNQIQIALCIFCHVGFFFPLLLPHYCGDKKLITPPAFTISSVCFLFPIMQSSSVAILFYAPPAHLRMTERVIFGMGRHYFSSTSLFSFFVLFSSHKPLSVLSFF